MVRRISLSRTCARMNAARSSRPCSSNQSAYTSRSVSSSGSCAIVRKRSRSWVMVFLITAVADRETADFEASILGGQRVACQAPWQRHAPFLASLTCSPQENKLQSGS